MFPLNSNMPYIKDDGKRDKLGNVIGSGSGGGSDIPEPAEGDAGKFLSVDDDLELSWETINGTKMYYKEYTNVKWDVLAILAGWNNGSAVETSIRFLVPSGFNTVDINIEGYTPICAIMRDIYTGYHMSAGIGLKNSTGTNYIITHAFATMKLSDGDFVLRVYYSKNDNTEQLT